MSDDNGSNDSGDGSSDKESLGKQQSHNSKGVKEGTTADGSKSVEKSKGTTADGNAGEEGGHGVIRPSAQGDSDGSDSGGDSGGSDE
ncbi:MULTISPECIES: hypothetical protein [Halolamina]|uniref:Uncharacterized protein n=2 Tax=Halolamina TaxID=1075397 RepID=A0A1I5VQS2_9EURY|nr:MULTISPECIES: hypothetical protein [Halolamina]NHX37826.1 hypothetical protein [Halolamina sp. R1-12]SFQ09627.1 hypothetical protein SAMN05216277_11927 [Halolamina pelagica]